MVVNPNQALRIRLSYFETKFEDLIDFDPVLWIPVNIGSARSHGFESSLEAIHGNFCLGFPFLTWMQKIRVRTRDYFVVRKFLAIL